MSCDETGVQSHMRDMIARAVLGDISWMKNPGAVAQWSIQNAIEGLLLVPLPSCEAFRGASFVAVTDPTEKPGTNAEVISVVGDEVYVMRSIADFQKIIILQCSRPITESEALEIAKQYVIIFGFNYPQYANKVKILNSSRDIPMRMDEIIPDELQVLIQPPQVKCREKIFTLRIYAWSELGGELCDFDICCSEEGVFEARKQVLREGLGSMWLPK